MSFEAITALCTDVQWSELLERRRGNADIFDVISIRETQHSDMLEWLFDARQGHGQGDAIFRDFLLAVYQAASKSIGGNGLTRDFIRDWTPARIMTTSFASTMFFREYRLRGAENEPDCILDLLVVDPDHKFVIAIENKAGARLTSMQLERYVERLRNSRLVRNAFHDFHRAFVALDRNHEDDPEGSGQACDPRWALINYEWLQGAAKRAELAEQRGNKDASIVLSYCRQQIGYESPNTREINRLARELATRHKTAVAALREADVKLDDPANWTRSQLDAASGKGQLLRLLLQNAEACRYLTRLPQIELLHGAVVHATQDPSLEDERVDKRRVRVYYRPVRSVPSLEEYWPLCVYARFMSGKSSGIRVSIMWHPNLVPDEVLPAYSALFQREFGAKKVTQKATRLDDIVVHSIEEARDAVIRMLQRCDAAMDKLA